MAWRAELAEALAATKPVVGLVTLAKAAAVAQSASDAQAKTDEQLQAGLAVAQALKVHLEEAAVKQAQADK